MRLQQAKACPHFAARIFKKILAGQLDYFIRQRL